MFQLLQIILGNGIFQHVGIHGRGHQLGAGSRQRHGGQHVVSQSVGQFGNHVGRGRGNQHQICRIGQRNMCHVILEIAVKGVHDAAVVGQRLEDQGGDEFGGVLGHQHVPRSASFGQRVGHIGHFVCSNAAGDAQNNRFALQVFFHNTVLPFDLLLCGFMDWFSGIYYRLV